MLQKAGGLFQILAELDFGTAFGIKALYLKSRATSPASAGAIRLGEADVINWRNNANSADLSLSIDDSDVLNFNGVGISVGGDPVQTEITVSDTATIDLTLATNNLSADIIAGSIDNSMISGSAAIAYSKLALTGSIVNADISSSAAIAYSKLSLSASIVNADISSSAAIANSKLAQMATLTIKGNNTGGSAVPSDLTGSQVTVLLSNFVGDSGSGGTKGLVPAPASGDSAAGKFLKADGTWTSPAGAGDVVGPASSTDSGFVKFDGTTGKLLKDSLATISNSDVASNAAIAFSKLAGLTAAHILVGSAGGVAADVAVSGDISMSNAGVTAYAGTVPLNKGGTGQTTKAAAFDALSPLSSAGDLLYGGTSGTGTRLAAGVAGQFLSYGSIPQWVTAPQLQRVFITSGTSWTSPSGITSSTILKFTLIAGGAGGGGAKGAWAGAGGGGGGSRNVFWASGLAASTSYTIAIGSGGSAGSSAGGVGGNGGNTSITIGATTYTANGGSGGAGSTNSSAVNYSLGGSGGSQTVNGDIIESGNSGGAGICFAANIPLGGFGGGGPTGVGQSGNTALGNAGFALGGFGAGGSGAASGSTTGFAGGAGVQGAILVEWAQ